VAPVYRCVDFTGEPALQEPEKHAAWGWFALDVLPAPLTQPTLAAVKALLA
jgi:8-oxo-dGTP diphosphatase